VAGAWAAKGGNGRTRVNLPSEDTVYQNDCEAASRQVKSHQLDDRAEDARQRCIWNFERRMERIQAIRPHLGIILPCEPFILVGENTKSIKLFVHAC